MLFFCLKTLLQDRKEHQKDTWCVFIDLVKAYDSIQYEVTEVVLEKMGTHLILIKLIMKLHYDFKVELKLEKKKKLSLTDVE